MSAPPAIRGRIEARGLGLLRCPVCGPVPLAGVLDLARVEAARLPAPATTDILGLRFPLIGTPEQGHDAAALMLLLRYGREGT